MQKSTHKKSKTATKRPGKTAAKRPASAAAKKPVQRNEGEGSRSAARRYDANAERAASNPKRVGELAKKAARALESPEGEELRAAEKIGKSGGLPRAEK